MKTSLKTLLLFLALLLTLVPIISMYFFSEYISAKTEETATKSLQEITLTNALKTNSDIIKICELLLIAEKSKSHTVKNTLLQALAKLGKPSLDNKLVEREVRNQNDVQQKWKEKIHLLKFGNTVVDCAQAEDKQSKINELLQSLKQRLKYDFTIYVKSSPDSNNFLRLASTYTDSLGENIAGSYFSGYTSLHQETVIKAILENTEYSCLINTPTSTRTVNYIPITDVENKVIGAIYFGTENNAIKEISKYISTVNIGKGSYAWIIDDSTPDNPVIKFSEQQTENTVSIKDGVSTVKKNIAYEIIEKSRTLKTGQIDYERFTSKIDSTKKTILTYAYFKPWNWIIGVVSDSEEYTTGATLIAKNFKFANSTILQITLIFSFMAFCTAYILYFKLFKRFGYIYSLMQKIIDINPSTALSQMEQFEKMNDNALEFSSLEQSLKPLAKRLENILDELVRDSSNLNVATSNISILVDELSEISSTEIVQMKDIAKSGRNILTSAEELNKATIVSASEIQKALLLNKDSENAIDALMRKYDTLATASNNVSRKLADINENAEKITSLITTISDVSLKTNMLSLNASIEAEKVGATGLGFAVVSRQIRTLADKTSKASQDIENIVQQMQSSVNTAVMEMDSFSANMRDNSATTIATAKKLSSTISNIEAIGPKFENISARIDDMSAIAVKITDAIKNLSHESSEIQKTLNKLLLQNTNAKTKSNDIKQIGEFPQQQTQQ
ncbi:MAG: Cache 3/Cache 2 fusion domain-containing protein [Opitutales bacterium]|nr:Cache 3/Cache 2 fusion domain-containing protein [Opitutales bacterium]